MDITFSLFGTKRKWSPHTFWKEIFTFFSFSFPAGSAESWNTEGRTCPPAYIHEGLSQAKKVVLIKNQMVPLIISSFQIGWVYCLWFKSEIMDQKVGYHKAHMTSQSHLEGREGEGTKGRAHFPSIFVWQARWCVRFAVTIRYYGVSLPRVPRKIKRPFRLKKKKQSKWKTVVTLNY